MLVVGPSKSADELKSLAVIRQARDRGEAKEKASLDRGKELAAKSPLVFWKEHTADLKGLMAITVALRDDLTDIMNPAFKTLNVTRELRQRFYASDLWRDMVRNHLEVNYPDEKDKEVLRDSYIRHYHSKERPRQLTTARRPISNWLQAVCMMWSSTQADYMRKTEAQYQLYKRPPQAIIDNYRRIGHSSAYCTNVDLRLFIYAHDKMCWLYYFASSMNRSTFLALARHIQEYITGPKHPKPDTTNPTSTKRLRN